MGVEYYYNQINKIEKEIADLHLKIAQETKREADKQKQIDAVRKTITKTTSQSTVQSKLSQIRSYENEIVAMQKRKADFYKKQSDYSKQLSDKRLQVMKEEERQREKDNREQEDFERNLRAQIESHRLSMSQMAHVIERPADFRFVRFDAKKFDFFISHASEDKEFARRLYQNLKDAGKEIWFDEMVLTVGDSLRRKIDEGLKNSKYGIVILSSWFFSKNWPQHELDGLVAKEMMGNKVILPIWHKTSKDEVMAYSPTLADKVALNTSIQSLDEIVAELLKVSQY
jgi:chemotaxis protein histidine kinase CheA